MLYVCNLIVYFVRNLFYKKLCYNITILLVNININYFLPIIMNFASNYFTKNYIMLSMLLDDNVYINSPIIISYLLIICEEIIEKITLFNKQILI